MKKFYIFLVILVIAGVVYYTGLYTYFIRTEIQESLPTPMTAAVKEPETLRMGSFGEVDFIHKGSGEAKLIRTGETTILRLENFNVVSGPDLHVYLTKTETPTGDIASLEDFIDLGLLKGTMGNQNYEIERDIEGYETVVIWCKRYGVLFTYAVMK